jgi:hypothetical protein
MILALAVMNSWGFCFAKGLTCQRVHATNAVEKPSKKCCLNGNNVSGGHLVCPSALSYTECFAVPSNSE